MDWRFTSVGNRKEEILIVALHLFARDGYEAVSVSQIAGELDMTKVEDLLTAGAFVLEDNINQPKTLFCNAAAFFFQLGQYDLSLHFRGLIAYLFLSVHNDLRSGCNRRRTEWIFRSFYPLSYCGQSMRLHLPVSPIQLWFP